MSLYFLCYVGILVLVQFDNSQGSNSTDPPRVMMSWGPFQVEMIANDDKLKKDKISWQTPLGTTGLYCVSETPAEKLEFSCPECIGSWFTKELKEKTKDLTNVAQFPVISVSGILVNKTLNGKGIECIATYKNSSGHLNKVTSSRTAMDIWFMDRPEILLDNEKRPVLHNKFYVEGPSKLVCNVTANPPPRKFSWVYGTENNGDKETLVVDASHPEKLLRCSAESAHFQRDSLAVRIDKYVPPKVTWNNFNMFKNESSMIKKGKNIKLQCKAHGNPKPNIKWFHKRIDGKTEHFDGCIEGDKLVTTTKRNDQGQMAKIISSNCTIKIENYTLAGSFWCEASNSRFQKDLQSTPSENVVDVNVVGSPSKTDVKPYVSEVPDQNMMIIAAPFCADPPPKPPGEIWWLIDNHQVNIEKKFDNYFAHTPTQNDTHPDCYTARLVVSPVMDNDKEKDYTLKIQNEHGSLSVDIPTGALRPTEEPISSSPKKFIGYKLIWLTVLLSVIHCLHN